MVARIEEKRIMALDQIERPEFRSHAEIAGPAAATWSADLCSRYPDPLGGDASDDVPVVTTTRRLARLSLAASEVGARFGREGLPGDPSAWMLSPRLMFGGRAAVDACQDLAGLERSLLMHGLGMELDAGPEDLERLLVGDAGPEAPISATAVDSRGGGTVTRRRFGAHRRRLLTCWVNVRLDGRRIYAFCAMVTDRPAELVDRVVERYGVAAAAAAEFAEGFDPTTVLATAMIGEALSDTLVLAAANPLSSIAEGLDVVVEQRFVA